MAMGNSKGIVKRLKIETIDAAKYLSNNEIWVQRLGKARQPYSQKCVNKTLVLDGLISE